MVAEEVRVLELRVVEEVAVQELKGRELLLLLRQGLMEVIHEVLLHQEVVDQELAVHPIPQV
jgi:hypothetical protein